jgi:hypothetical protein
MDQKMSYLVAFMFNMAECNVLEKPNVHRRIMAYGLTKIVNLLEII